MQKELQNATSKCLVQPQAWDMDFVDCVMVPEVEDKENVHFGGQRFNKSLLLSFLSLLLLSWPFLLFLAVFLLFLLFIQHLGMLRETVIRPGHLQDKEPTKSCKLHACVECVWNPKLQKSMSWITLVCIGLPSLNSKLWLRIWRKATVDGRPKSRSGEIWRTWCGFGKARMEGRRAGLQKMAPPPIFLKNSFGEKNE